MAILLLRAACGWSLKQTGRRFLVTPATISSWVKRVDEQGPNSLVEHREPVNKFPDFVRYAVQRLKAVCPGSTFLFPRSPDSAARQQPAQRARVLICQRTARLLTLECQANGQLYRPLGRCIPPPRAGGEIRWANTPRMPNSLHASVRSATRPPTAFPNGPTCRRSW
jgi:hypothetical protein